MTTPRYKSTTKDVLLLLDLAMERARALLPKDLDWQHYIASRHAPDAASAWEHVRHAYAIGGEEDISNVLADLVMMAKAASCLRSVVIEQPTLPLDLSLPKTRRTP